MFKSALHPCCKIVSMASCAFELAQDAQLLSAGQDMRFNSMTSPPTECACWEPVDLSCRLIMSCQAAHSRVSSWTSAWRSIACTCVAALSLRKLNGLMSPCPSWHLCSFATICRHGRVDVYASGAPHRAFWLPASHGELPSSAASSSAMTQLQAPQ